MRRPSRRLRREREASKKPRKKAERNIGKLPENLPRCERVIEPTTTQCPCCNGKMHRIGEDVSETLDRIPATLRVLRTIRPKVGVMREVSHNRTLSQNKIFIQ